MGSVAFIRYAVVQWNSAGAELKAPRLRGIKPSALRLATVEASMKAALCGVCEVASDHAAPRCAPRRWALGIRYAEGVWSMQAFGLVGRMEYRSTLHHRPNPVFNRSAERQRRSVPVALLRVGARLTQRWAFRA